MTSLKPELSKKSDYWIPRERYYELKYFCLQYPTWRNAYDHLYSLPSRPTDFQKFCEGTSFADPTAKVAEAALHFKSRMEKVEKAAEDTDPVIGRFIFQAVTEGKTYEQVAAKETVCCCRSEWYKLYRRFFWILSRSRD